MLVTFLSFSWQKRRDCFVNFKYFRCAGSPGNTSHFKCDSPLLETRYPLVLHNITSVSDSISVDLCFSGIPETAEEPPPAAAPLLAISVLL